MLCRYYRCRNCNFVLDIIRGVSDDDAMGNMDAVLPPDPSRTTLSDVPVIWMCPLCLSSREEFEEYLEGAIEASLNPDQQSGDDPDVRASSEGAQIRIAAKHRKKKSAEGGGIDYEEYRPG